MRFSLLPRRVKDLLAGKAMLVLTVLAALLVLLMIVGLYPEVQAHPRQPAPRRIVLFQPKWRPFRGQFGFLPFIMGTVWVTGVAMLIAVPLVPAHRHLPLRIRPSPGPRMGQAPDRPSGRHPVGRLRRLGHAGDRPLRQGHVSPRFSASFPPATASWPAASSWPS